MVELQLRLQSEAAERDREIARLRSEHEKEMFRMRSAHAAQMDTIRSEAAEKEIVALKNELSQLKAAAAPQQGNVDIARLLAAAVAQGRATRLQKTLREHFEGHLLAAVLALAPANAEILGQRLLVDVNIKTPTDVIENQKEAKVGV